MAEVPWTNIVVYAAAALAPSVVCWAVLAGPRLVRMLRRQRIGPEGPPIEQLAADLRRVHRVLAHVAAGTPNARRRGARQAYDNLLVQACTAVGVPHRLGELPEGVDREIERLRIEESLRGAGLRIP
jgi:hypothetical protein